jgi:hypothetical protein
MENREKRKESMSRDQAIGDMGGRIKLGIGKNPKLVQGRFGWINRLMR